MTLNHCKLLRHDCCVIKPLNRGIVTRKGTVTFSLFQHSFMKAKMNFFIAVDQRLVRLLLFFQRSKKGDL